MTDSTIHLNVMRRVRTIHALQSSATGAGVSVLLLVLSLYFIGREVWVAHVLQNMPSFENIRAFSHFFTYAFFHTSIIVQGLILLTIFSTLWFIREVARALLSGSQQWVGA